MHILALVLRCADAGAPGALAQARFYGGVLGLPLLEQTNTRVSLLAGETRLSFEAAPAGWHGAYHFAFNIPAQQLAAAKAWLAGRVPLVRGSAGEDEFDFRNWQARALYFYDPAGNIVELIARQAVGDAAGPAVGSASLLGVSELGLASTDVAETVRLLAAALGVGVFRGSINENFAAVGGETGLFIVVREGRPWFPDQRVTADRLPVAATVRVADGRQFTVSGPPYAVTPAP
jgi:catechol-2,3-dioxygenase